MIGAIEPSSDANSQSFYSNNTSAISSNLNNSRYLLNNNRRETKVPNIHVGKVIPNMIFNNYKDNLWILEHFILLKIEETTDEYQRLVK